MLDRDDRLAAAEAQLALYRDAFESMPQGLCVFDSEGRITLVNGRYEELLRLSPNSVRPGQTGSDIIQLCMDAGHHPGTTLEEIQAQIRNQLDSGAPSLATVVRGDRSYAMKQSRTPTGNLVTTCEDITAQVDAESALRGSKARLNAILDAMPDCVKIFDESGRLIHINPRGLELLQAPDLDSVLTPGYSPVPPEYLDACLDVHRRVMAGESVVWTYEVIGLFGRRRHVEAHAVPFFMPDGTTTHLCISRDVEERQNAADALRASEERLRLVQDATGLADFEMDAQGAATCSDRFFEQLGLPVGDPSVRGEKGWIHLVHPEDRERILKELQAANDQQQVWSQSEFRIVRADNGAIRWIACSTKMERDEHGALIRMIGGHLDITERKEAENALRRSEERLRLVQEATGLADFEATAEGIVQLSERFIEQTGLPPGTGHVSLEQWMRIVHPEDRQRQQRDIARSLDDDEAFSCEFRIIRPDNGEVRWISSRTKVERDVTGAANRIGGHLDITERKNAEEALRESEERFRLAAEAAGLGVWDYDLALDRREWSGRLREILGFSEDVEPSMAAVLACIHPADREKFERTLREAHSSNVARFEASFRILRPSDGAERWISLSSWRTSRADNSMRRIITTVRDVTDEKTAEERVRWSASHDPLTRLANRGLFQEKLDQAIRAAACNRGAVGLLLLDLDHFKQVNDTLGHDAGDMLLRMFAKRLHGVVRAHDTVARLGGDEFAIVVPDIDTDQSVIQLAQSIQDRLRDPFIHEGRLLDCRVSIGASLFPEHGTTSEELLKNADCALYASKAGGRGMVSLFELHMRDNVHRRSSMVQLARNALREDRIVPFYQPKLELGVQKLVGFEALLRWRTSSGRVGSPATIEAAFEDLEVAAQISDRMIERVITDMRGWLDKGIEFNHVAVNASAAEFRRDNFAERVLDQLRAAKIPTRCFQLEVTETVFLGRGAEYVHRALALLSSRGVKIALDDFGTGYASLRHLKQFPVDIIKIDQSFVSDMEAEPGDEAIVRAVINLGRSLGIKVVAEGIEREQQATRLIELECDFGQGFLFSKAVPASRVPSLVERWPALPEPRLRQSGKLRLVASRH